MFCHHPIKTSVYVYLHTFAWLSTVLICLLDCFYHTLLSFVPFSCSIWNILPCWMPACCLSSNLSCLHPAIEFSPLYPNCYCSWYVLSIAWRVRLKYLPDVSDSSPWRCECQSRHVIPCRCVHHLHQFAVRRLVYLCQSSAAVNYEYKVLWLV